jgi:hypothetical protein
MAAKAEGPLPFLEQKGLDVPYEKRRAQAAAELEQTLAGPRKPAGEEPRRGKAGGPAP